MEEELFVTSVPRSLETKNKIFGLELIDVLVLLVNFSIQNLVFGETYLKVPMVYGSSVLLAVLFIWVKRGRPDGFIAHALEHLFSSSVFESNQPDRAARSYQKEGCSKCQKV